MRPQARAESSTRVRGSAPSINQTYSGEKEGENAEEGKRMAVIKQSAKREKAFWKENRPAGGVG